MTPVNLAQELAQFDDHWSPHVVASTNDNDVMVVKLQGEFPFHKHGGNDDFFRVLEGHVTMDYADHPSVAFGPGEMVVVPAGVVHRPRAAAEAKVLLIEPRGEPNTGDADAPAAPKPISERRSR